MIPNWYRKTSYRDIRTANKFNYQSNPKAKTIWTHLESISIKSPLGATERHKSAMESQALEISYSHLPQALRHTWRLLGSSDLLCPNKSRDFLLFFFSSCLRVKRDQGRRRGSEISKVWLLSLTTHQINSERLAIRVDMSSLAASLVTGVGLRPERPILYQPTSFPSSR